MLNWFRSCIPLERVDLRKYQQPIHQTGASIKLIPYLYHDTAPLKLVLALMLFGYIDMHMYHEILISDISSTLT